MSEFPESFFNFWENHLALKHLRRVHCTIENLLHICSISMPSFLKLGIVLNFWKASYIVGAFRRNKLWIAQQVTNLLHSSMNFFLLWWIWKKKKLQKFDHLFLSCEYCDFLKMLLNFWRKFKTSIRKFTYFPWNSLNFIILLELPSNYIGKLGVRRSCS